MAEQYRLETDDSDLLSVYDNQANTLVAIADVIRKEKVAELVRRANAFDDLVAACQAVLDAKEYNGERWLGVAYNAVVQVRAALAKATGGTD